MLIWCERAFTKKAHWIICKRTFVSFLINQSFDIKTYILLIDITWHSTDLVQFVREIICVSHSIIFQRMRLLQVHINTVNSVTYWKLQWNCSCVWFNIERVERIVFYAIWKSTILFPLVLRRLLWVYSKYEEQTTIGLQKYHSSNIHIRKKICLMWSMVMNMTFWSLHIRFFQY